MTSRERKAESDMIRILWTAIKHHKSVAVPASKISKYLMTEAGIMEDEVAELLNNAVADGLVEVNGGSSSTSNRNRKSPNRLYRIPVENGELISDLDHDLYCFECHSPKNLQKCTSCPRVFHKDCVQSHTEPAEMQNTSPRNQHESIDDSGIVAGDASSITTEILTTTAIPANASASRQPSVDLVESKPSFKTENAVLGDDLKAPVLLQDIQPDVICIGQVRPPSRRKRRITSSYNKPEANIHVETDANGDRVPLCSSCRLKQSAVLRDPPLNAEEMNFLLKFIFARIKTWITSDTYSPLPMSSIPMPSKQEFDLFENKCMRFPKTIDYIDKKLKASDYKTLTEFQCDFMDIRHSIGILYGVKSAEYEAIGYLLRDCAFELSEIRKCPDCYRHSNEKTNENWFCKPCVPRHELVFAKQIGYTHWPAKVIKFENGRYDVRFFGKQHLRAVIDASHVLPIDTELASLKLKKVVSFTRAMDELQRHQELLQWPAGYFSYEAERKNPVDLNELLPAMNSKKVKATKGKKVADNSAANELESNMESSPGVSNITATSTASIFLSAISNAPMGVKQTLKVRLKRTKQNTTAGLLVDDSLSGVAPNKKMSPSSCSTPLKKRAIMRGRKKSMAPETIDPYDANENSASQSRSAISDNDLEPQTTQTNGDGSHDEEHSPNQSPKTSTTPGRIKSKLGKPKQDTRDNLLRELQLLKCPPAACNVAMEAVYAERERMKQLIEEQNRILSETKKKQWCYYCEKEAIYHCCWNTAYCSTECQQKHWHTEHKKTCRRKR